MRGHGGTRTITRAALVRSGQRSREYATQDVVLGPIAVVIGAALCFRGYLALRVVIAMWGALVAGDITVTADRRWWWNRLYAALVVVGVAVQLRTVEARREGVRAAWMA